MGFRMTRPSRAGGRTSVHWFGEILDHVGPFELVADKDLEAHPGAAAGKARPAGAGTREARFGPRRRSPVRRVQDRLPRGREA